MLIFFFAVQLAAFAVQASMMAGFSSSQASAIGIIGGADGPTPIYVASQINPWGVAAVLLAAGAIAALVVFLRRRARKNRG